MPEFFWIKNELSRFYPDADFSKGIDLNRNGKLEKNEQIVDANRNGKVGDLSDWKAFFKKNTYSFRKLGGLFQWGRGFSPNNPIHDAISIESELLLTTASGSVSVQRAYERSSMVLQGVKTAVRGKNLSAEEKLHTIYQVMKATGFKIIEKQSSPLFVQNVSQNSLCLDCDSSSFLVLAIAHEMGWPVHLVAAPGHVFIRWDDGKGTRINIDNDSIKPDAFYLGWLNIPEESVRQGIYLKNLSREETLALFFENRGLARNLSGDYRKAIDDYTRAIELNPKFVTALNNRGNAKSALGDYRGAIRDYEQAIALNKNNAIAFNGLGNAKSELGDMKSTLEALENFKKATSLNPQYAEAWNNQGVTERTLGHIEEAIICCKKAIALNSKYAEAFRNLGIAEGVRENFLEAVSYYKKAIDINSGYADAWNSLGIVENALGHREEAEKAYRMALKLNPNFADAWNNLGILENDLGKYEEAIEFFQHALQLRPKYAEAYNNYGVTKYNQQKYQEAKDAHDRAIELNPQYIDAYYNRARARQKLGDSLGAKKDLGCYENLLKRRDCS